MRKEALSDLASLVLRIGIAFVFFYFGLDKFINLQANMAIVNAIGMSNAFFLTIFYGIVEILVGFALLIGLFVRLTAVIASVMLAAIILLFWLKLHIFVPRDIGLLATLLFLVLNGGGRISLDKFIRFRRIHEHI